MSQVWVTSDDGEISAEVIDTLEGYEWRCECLESGEHHRLTDILEHAGTHVDLPHD